MISLEPKCLKCQYGMVMFNTKTETYSEMTDYEKPTLFDSSNNVDLCAPKEIGFLFSYILCRRVAFRYIYCWKFSHQLDNGTFRYCERNQDVIDEVNKCNEYTPKYF